LEFDPGCCFGLGLKNRMVGVPFISPRRLGGLPEFCVSQCATFIVPFTADASFSHSGASRWQYPHPLRQILMKTPCGLSTTSFCQFLDVSCTTFEEN